LPSDEHAEAIMTDQSPDTSDSIIKTGVPGNTMLSDLMRTPMLLGKDLAIFRRLFERVRRSRAAA
jgi:hypothetical protein